MGIMSFVFFICALRTNIVYVVIFLSLVVGFGLDAGQHFQLALGNIDLAAGLQSVSFISPNLSLCNTVNNCLGRWCNIFCYFYRSTVDLLLYYA
jgi:succinate-acetate transporter protein